MYYLTEYPAKELESLMEKYPLSKEEADDILDNISGVEFTEKIAVPAILCIKRDGVFIKIRKSDPEEEKKKSAIHAFLHFDYKAGGCMSDKSIFLVLEKETERIYRENQKLADYIFREFKAFQAK